MATTVTGIILLLAIMAKVSASTIIYRGTVVFFIFGLLGTILGSFLEILLIPITTERETEKLQEELILEDASLRDELGDLLDDPLESELETESFGTPTDDFKQMAAASADSGLKS
jgi:hypothetical protein